MADTELELRSQLVTEPTIHNPLRSVPIVARPTPSLHNVVSSVNFGCRLDLRTIAFHARNIEYNPKKIDAAIMRLREPKTVALIFSSGKIICVGAKSEEQSLQAARKYARIIRKLGFDIAFNDFKILNIIATCDIGCSLSLTHLAINHGQFSFYEPELCPGLFYRMKKSKIVVEVYPSGKIIIAGTRKTAEIFEAFENIYPVLMNYRINK